MSQVKLISAFRNKEYAAFMLERDRVLEQLLLNSLKRQTAIMRSALYHLVAQLRGQLDGKLRMRAIEQIVRQELNSAVPYLAQEMSSLKRKAYIFSGVGAAEALARLMGSGRYDFSHHTTNTHFKDDKTHEYVTHYVGKLATKIIHTVYLSHVINEEDSKTTIAKVLRDFPRVKRLVKPPVVMARMTEARPFGEAPERHEMETEPTDMAQGQVSDEDWASIVDDYANAYVPDTRGPEDIIDKDSIPAEYDVPKDEQVYAWDVENQLTQDFIGEVRAGENDAANQNGIDDFVWVAILDSKTDDCCEWRDGLLTSEIEEQLEGDHSDDDCDATAAPAHFNCRCRNAPAVSEAFEDVQSNAADFSDWLKAA